MVTRRAKIVCTIGPASDPPDVLAQVIEAGDRLTTFAELARRYALASATGAVWQRWSIYRELVESPSGLDWTVVDGIAERDARAGLRSLVVLQGPSEGMQAPIFVDSVGHGVDDPERRGHLWMLRNDLAGYVLLGDPAARLPIQPQLAARPVAPLDPYVALGLSPPSGMHPPPSSAAAPAPEAIAAPPVDPEALERAIGLLLAGEMGTNKILRECQLDLGRRELEELAERYAAAGRRALGLRLG